MSLRDTWSALRGWEQAALSLALCCGLVAAAGLPIGALSRVCAPEVAVSLHVATYGMPESCGTGVHPLAYRDPWSRPWRGFDRDDMPLYSTGPNGLDEGRAGDDVPMSPGGGVVALLSLLALAAPRALVVGVALAWVVAVRRGLHRGARSSTPVEVGRSALAVSLPAVGLVAAASAVNHRLVAWAGPRAEATGALLVSLPVAIAGSAAFAALLAVLAWRLRQPEEPGQVPSASPGP